MSRTRHHHHRQVRWNKNPGYWNRQQTQVPYRVKVRDLTRKVLLLIDLESTPEFPPAKRPVIYYW